MNDIELCLTSLQHFIDTYLGTFLNAIENCTNGRGEHLGEK